MLDNQTSNFNDRVFWEENYAVVSKLRAMTASPDKRLGADYKSARMKCLVLMLRNEKRRLS